MRLAKAVKITVIAVPVLLVAVFAVAVIVLLNTDFNKYKPMIAEETKAAIGRDLVIAGDLEVSISLTPSVSVEGVTLSNAKWGARPEMIRVERLEAQISLLPLVFGVIDVKRVVLVGADILLEVDKKGVANFDFKPPVSAKAGKKQDGAAAKKAPDAPAESEALIPVVREVLIRDSRLRYTDARSGARYDTVIESLTLRGDGPDEPLELDYAGSYNGSPIKLAVTLGAPAELLKPSRPWPVDLTLEAGGATLTIKGTIAEPLKAKGLNLAVAISGDQLGALSKLAGAPVPAMGAYSLSARIAGTPAATIELTGFKATIGDNDLSGKLTVNLSGKRPSISAVLKSKKIDLATLAGASTGAGKKDGGGGGGAKQPARKPDRVFSAEPLALDGLRAVDVRMKFDAGTIVVSGAVLRNVSLGLSLKAGNLLIKPVKSGIADGSLNGSIQLDGRKKVAGLVVKLALDKIDLDRLLTDLKITGDVEGKANISIDVSGRGSSVRAIMASLGGRAGLLMGKGRMKDSFLQSMLGGSGQLLSRILDRGKKGYTAVECAVADFTIRKGVATAKALYLDLDSRGVIGSGTVNLGKERLNLTIDPRNKKKIGKPVLPVRITGTFLAPKYKIDKNFAAGKLTSMLGVQLPSSLTGGKSATGTPLIEGPCAPPAPKAAKKQQATQQPTQQPKPKDPLKDAEEQLKKGLKGLFGN
jgi:uncharacterized protein involved in outer membrane biogenesis